MLETIQVAPMLASMAAGVLMIQYGLRYQRLQWRDAGRKCPSCSRRLKSRVCNHCVGS
jgi:hypothetical protein